MFKEQSHRRRDGMCQTWCLVQFSRFPLDVGTRKPRFPSKQTRLEAWSSSQQLGQGMEPVGGSTSYQRPSKQVILKSAWPLVTDLAGAHLLFLSVVNARTPCLSPGQEDACCFTQILRQVTSKMLLYNLSTFCPDCQTSEYPDSLSAGVSKSSSYHFLGTGLFHILGISKPVSLQLS